jgi:hypothetical protein
VREAALRLGLVARPRKDAAESPLTSITRRRYFVVGPVPRSVRSLGFELIGTWSGWPQVREVARRSVVPAPTPRLAANRVTRFTMTTMRPTRRSMRTPTDRPSARPAGLVYRTSSAARSGSRHAKSQSH